MLCLIPLGLMFCNILLLACILRDYNEHIKNCRRWEDQWLKEQLKQDKKIKEIIESCKEDIICIRNMMKKED